MNPSLLRSLTPFTASGLDSRALQVLCKILNAIYFTAAVYTIIKFAIGDPWKLGWITSGLIALIVYVVIGFILQVGRNIAVEKNIQVYNQFVNTAVSQIDVENVPVDGTENGDNSKQKQSDESNCNRDTQEKQSEINLTSKDIDSIKCPFSSEEGKIAFAKIIDPIPNHTITPDSAKAIAAALIKLNKNATPHYKLLTTKNQIDIIKWFCKEYKIKLTKDNEHTIYTAKKEDQYSEHWEQLFKPLFDPQNANSIKSEDNSAR